MMYVAAPGAPVPTQVHNGMFSPKWNASKLWQKCTLVDVHLVVEDGNSYSGLTTYWPLRQKARLRITWSIGMPLNFLPDLVCALGFETSTRDERLYIPQARAGHFDGFRSVEFDVEYFGGNYNADLFRIFAAGNFPYGRLQLAQPVPSSASIAPVPSGHAAQYGSGSAMDLVPGRLRGYREWVLRDRREGGRPPMLASITANFVWPWTPEYRAVCKRTDIYLAGATGFPPTSHDPDDVPNELCSCGIYAKHRPNVQQSNANIRGVIEAWGKVEIGTYGFRAEKARIVALCATPQTRIGISPDWFLHGEPLTEIVEQLAKTYRVPVFTDWSKLLTQYPPIDISALMKRSDEPESDPPSTNLRCPHGWPPHASGCPYC